VASDASQVLGKPELAGVMVNPRGFSKRAGAFALGGLIGSAIGTAVTAKQQGEATSGAVELPKFGRVGYLAATGDEVALVKTDSGLLKMKISDTVLARAPRAEIESTELDKGALVSRLEITFKNGVSWAFDVPKANRKGAEKLTQALGGSVT